MLQWLRGAALTALRPLLPPQIVCVPHDWRVTLVIIMIGNAAASFLLEVRLRNTTPCLLAVIELLLKLQTVICMH